MVSRRLDIPAGAPAPNCIVVERIEDLIRINGHDVEGSDGSNLVFGFDQGGVSRARFRTHPGAVWLSSCEVWLANAGDLLPCRFGAVFQDNADKIVKWWHSPPAKFDDGGPLRLRYEVTSPEGAAWVRLGMMGPWSENKKSTAAYRYAGCRLELLASAPGQQEQT